MSRIKNYLNEILEEVRNIELFSKEIHATVVGEFPYAQIIGPEGMGKTSQVQSWAEENNISLIKFPIYPFHYDSDATTEKVVSQIKLVIQSRLEAGKCVILFDDYERASSNYKRIIEELSKSHYLDVDSERYSENLLFVIIIENGY